MPGKRKKISPVLERELFEEAGWRCAVPNCRTENTAVLEMAHIIPVKEGGENAFANMILLCANCHSRFDKGNEKNMDRSAMIRLKKNLSVINGRYSHFEFRVLEYFSLKPEETSILLWGRDLDVLWLLRDGLLAETTRKFQNSINFPPKEYLLTQKGRKFIDRWRENDPCNMD